MANSTRSRPAGSDDEIDISTSDLSRWMNTQVNWFVWAVALGAVLLLFFLWEAEWLTAWMLMALPALAVPAMAGWVTWILIVRRGIFTWMPLARRPAAVMAQGDVEGAERAYRLALERARRFPPKDHRRGLMLFELAAFVQNQGRYPEAKALLHECVEILSVNQRAYPMDYFVGLNNYAIYFIHLRDYAAAQSTLEKVLDLTLATKKGANQKIVVLPHQIRELEFVLHLNLVFLFIQMRELAEAAFHMEEADAVLPGLAKRSRARLYDHYVAFRSLLVHASGRLDEADREIQKAKNPEYGACLRVRAKLHLERAEFPEAEQLLRKYLDQERKKGSLHRPDLLVHTLEFAESMFGQGKHEAAIATLMEACSIAADFELPADAAWRKTLETWLQRARELGKADVVAALNTEIQRVLSTSNQDVTILEKFRVPPRARGEISRAPSGKR
jgi:tetratricopeptide (TPR) repeat protein